MTAATPAPGKGTTPRPQGRRLALSVGQLPARWVPGTSGPAGGVEIQYDLVSRALAAAGLDVAVLGAPADGAVPPAGIRLVEVRPRPGRTPALLRNLAAVWRASKEADAALYVQSAAGVATFPLALRARLTGRRFVYHWASDADVDGRLMSGGRIERALFRAGRRLAHRQACQTSEQMALLPRRQRKRALLLPNVADTTLAWRPARGKDILWVASIKPKAKRPHLFLDLAQALPRRTFRMVGDLRGPPEFQAEFRQRLKALPNVTWVGPVERTAMPTQYAAARCLVNTSDTEGFPNTFLEACCAGLPIVSVAIDPNRMLRDQGAGLFLDGDPSKLATTVESLFDDKVWRPLSQGASAVAKDHSPETAVKILSQLLQEA